MEKYNLYKDIQLRTGGEIYVGVVGPVRTGKSTFVRKFVELMVLPHMREPEKSRTRDELPSSGSGKTVTTVEPKFIPRTAEEIQMEDGTGMKIRLVDCVGYLVSGVEGTEEDGKARMVQTPWSDQAVSFENAARTGTQKVIIEHSSVGIVITTDGSIGEIPRQNFLQAEKEVIESLQKIGKPFLVLINSSDPEGKIAKDVKISIVQTYGITPLIVNCDTLGKADILNIMEQLLYEFPLTEIQFLLPEWVETLKNDHWLKKDLFQSIKKTLTQVHKIRDIREPEIHLQSEYIQCAQTNAIDLATGKVMIHVTMMPHLYYKILSEMTGIEIKNEYQLISLVREISGMKTEYEQVAEAMNSARSTGYGIIIPDKKEIHRQEPELIKHGNRYGIRVKADAPSYHLIRAEVETEIAPVVGSEEEAKELIQYIENEWKDVTQHNSPLIFGKSLDQMIEDGIRNRLYQVNEDVQNRLQNALKRIVNHYNGRLIFIII